MHNLSNYKALDFHNFVNRCVIFRERERVTGSETEDRPEAKLLMRRITFIFDFWKQNPNSLAKTIVFQRRERERRKSYSFNLSLLLLLLLLLCDRPTATSSPSLSRNSLSLSLEVLLSLTNFFFGQRIIKANQLVENFQTSRVMSSNLDFRPLMIHPESDPTVGILSFTGCRGIFY